MYAPSISWELSFMIIITVYIPPQADQMCARWVINEPANAHVEVTSIVVGNLNMTNMIKDLPKYNQHINLPTRSDQNIDHWYSKLRNSYKLLPDPALLAPSRITRRVTES